MIRFLIVLQQAFSLWMLVDAIRRGSRAYWYLVVLMPFGEWVYFFAVKIHDPSFDWARDLFRQLTTKKPSLDRLRARVEQSPSYAARLELAQALHDEQLYAEARGHFVTALGFDENDCDARYGVARCHLALEEYDAAIDELKRLIELDPPYREYSAWKDAAYALSHSERHDEAIALLSELVDHSPRLEHRMALSHYLVHADRAEPARSQLELALREYEDAPKFIKCKDRAWARGARKMLRELAVAG